ncbi:hypothetical protein [Helicobacter pullorum]
MVLTQIWANKPSSKEKKEQFVINEESFNLIKSALIKVIKENKELKERLNQLETKVDRNSQNILVLASYSKDKIKEIKLQNNEEFERFKAQQKEVLEKTKKQKKIPNKKAQKQEAISTVKERASKLVKEIKQEQTKSKIELDMEKAQKILDEKSNGGNQ